jgi:hypothetical protein
MIFVWLIVSAIALVLLIIGLAKSPILTYAGSMSLAVGVILFCVSCAFDSTSILSVDFRSVTMHIYRKRNPFCCLCCCCTTYEVNEDFSLDEVVEFKYHTEGCRSMVSINRLGFVYTLLCMRPSEVKPISLEVNRYLVSQRRSPYIAAGSMMGQSRTNYLSSSNVIPSHYQAGLSPLYTADLMPPGTIPRSSLPPPMTLDISHE